MAKLERTLVIIKPDAVNRGLVGEIIHRFERKGLEIIGMKMKNLQDKELEEHYAHHKDKPFFKDLVDFMKHSPSILMVIEGVRAIEAVRFLSGSTYGLEADPGTIRGDFSMSTSNNIVHASDSVENAEVEIDRFFKKDEIFSYKRVDWQEVYNLEEQSI
jgi:nucleoside-diphosphate kinase